MACGPADLLPDARCLTMLSRTQLIASWAFLVCEWEGPVVEGSRITEEGEDRITEEGDIRIIED